MDENQVSFSELYEAASEAEKVIIETLKPMIERLAERVGKALGETPRYLLYEAVHPRKKPRGSIRRKKKKARETNGKKTRFSK